MVSVQVHGPTMSLLMGSGTDYGSCRLGGTDQWIFGAVLSDDKTLYFIFCHQGNWPFGQKIQYNVATKVQDSFKIKQKGALPTKVWSFRLINYSTMGRQHVFFYSRP